MSEYRNFSIIGVQARQDRFNRSSVTGCMLVGQLFVKLVYVELRRAARAGCFAGMFLGLFGWQSSEKSWNSSFHFSGPEKS